MLPDATKVALGARQRDVAGARHDLDHTGGRHQRHVTWVTPVADETRDLGVT